MTSCNGIFNNVENNSSTVVVSKTKKINGLLWRGKSRIQQVIFDSINQVMYVITKLGSGTKDLTI